MAQAATRRRGIAKGAAIGVGILILLLVLLILFWRWDWFIPIVERQASAAIGRPVTIEHLHVKLGRTTMITADDVAVAGTDAFPHKLATAEHLTIAVRLSPLIRHRQVVLPLIDLDHPAVDVLGKADGANNYGLKFASSSKPSNPDTATQLGVIRIEQGRVHVEVAKYKADFNLKVQTKDTPDPFTLPLPADQGEIEAKGDGRYAGQPITVDFTGGAILSLRDKTKPYPIDLKVANGPTKVAVKGTVEQPLTFGGARIRLSFSGPDMALLFPLTGVPIPTTPPFSVAGKLDYSKQKIEFSDFTGRVGSSDLNGTISVLPGHVPTVDAALTSHKVDLKDLGGFVGASPGKTETKAAAKRTDGNVLPDTPINLPKIRAANVHLTYKGDHIENRDVPLDNIVARLDIVDGAIDLKQLDFAVGSGRIASSVSIDPNHGLATKAHADFHHIDLSRVMQATHAFHGQGIIGGKADLNSHGDSVAQMMANGSGGLTLVMSGGGDISALLPDIAGLELGNAILSALGLPNRAMVECFVADMPLKDGIMSTNAFLLQTSEARSVGTGTIDFHNQTLDFALTTRSSHFSVGSLPGPIHLSGKLGNPSILPGKEVVARAGAATALGVLLPPLALLPTIQFGVGERGACGGALEKADDHPAAHNQAVPAHVTHAHKH